MKNTEKRIALVTGASRGIGAAIAERLAQDDFDLILTCRQSMESLMPLSEQLRQKYGISCRAVQCDMGKEDSVQALFAQFSHLDVLVNNAGISYVGLLSEMSSEDWHRVLATNLDSCFYTSRAAIPLMLQRHSGKIINISSVWGNVGASMEVAYSASKGGVNAFTQALAKELAPSNIQVNAIACGVIDTAMNACFTTEELQALREEIPADRLGKAEEVASLAQMLTQAPSYLTGQIITLDGGWT